LRPLLCLPLHSHPHTPHLHSFPPRRSSDLFTPYLTVDESLDASTLVNYGLSMNHMSPSAITSFTIPNNGTGVTAGGASVVWPDEDRKSTRLNSSHVSISYAVFCLQQQQLQL